MKVAILGAGSAVGARMIESFQLGEGPSMTAVDRDPTQLAAAARFAVDLRVADVFDVESLASSFAGCSAAVHLLALEPSTLKRSVTAFCRAAAQARVRRLIYVSSADVYGLPPATGSDESAAIHVRHAFERINALAAADRQFSAECRTLELGGVVLRPGSIYGPRSEWFTHIIQELQADRAQLVNAGAGICNCVYIDHVVAAIRLILKTKTLPGPAFILADEEPLTWRNFYDAIASELELPPPRLLRSGSPESVAPATGEPLATPSPAPELAREARARQESTWKFSSRRAAQTLALPPPIAFAEAVRRSAAWWRFAHGDIALA